MEVQDDFYLATAADIVADPSAPDAFVRGVMEGVEWVMDPDAGLKMIKVADETQKQVKKMSVKQIEEQKLAIFDNYLKSLLGK
jgi:ABC-type nitrate/sulfonate/bicarbonate transport system substrate-binding protein